MGYRKRPPSVHASAPARSSKPHPRAPPPNPPVKTGARVRRFRGCNKGKRESRYTTCGMLIAVFRAWDVHVTRVPKGDTARTSPRSSGFCAIWDCISSSSSFYEWVCGNQGRKPKVESRKQVTPGHDAERQLTRGRIYTHTQRLPEHGSALSQLRETRALAKCEEKAI